jgi:hypothetical protein
MWIYHDRTHGHPSAGQGKSEYAAHQHREHASRIAKLVEATHKAGAKMVVQINHAGRQTSSAVTGSPITDRHRSPVLEMRFLMSSLLRRLKKLPKLFRLLPGVSRRPVLTVLNSTWPMGIFYVLFFLRFPTEEVTFMEGIFMDGPDFLWKY